MAKLPELCSIQYGYAFDSTCFTEDSTYLPLVRIRDVKRGYSETFYSGNYPNDYIIDNSSLLVGMDGEFNIARWKGGNALLNQRVCKITARKNVDEEYLRFALTKALKEIENRTAFVTVKHLSAKELNRLEIDIPDYKVQISISGTLTKIENIILTRQHQLQKLDELVKARFVELFGSPCINSKGFQTQKGSSLFKISNGRAVPNDRRFETGIPAYGGNGISWYTDDILCKNDTIVIGRVGFQSGNVHLVKGPVWITDNAMYISELYDDNLSLVFLCAMMEHIDFTKQQDAGDLKKVTQKPFMETEYILPPKSLQEKYISFVEQVDKSKVAVQKSLDEAQLLFDSLMQQYFG